MPGRRHRKANPSPTRQHCRGPNILGRIARSSGRACSVIQSHDQLSADRKTPTSPSRQMERGHCSERHLPNGESRLHTVCTANAKLAGLGCYNVGRCHCVVRYAIAVSTWPGSKQLSGACFFQSVILISSACSRRQLDGMQSQAAGQHASFAAVPLKHTCYCGVCMDHCKTE